MRRPLKITTPHPLRKSVSIAPAGAAVAERPVLARVRDSLVLRVVRKRKPAVRSPRHEPDAR